MLAIIVFTVNISYSQKWEKDKPDKLYATDKDGSVTNVKVGIGTSSPQNSLDVTGTTKTDSLIVNGGAHIYGKLQVGSNSLVLGDLTPTGNNHIYSTNGPLFIQSYGGHVYNTILNFDAPGMPNNGNVGIGTDFLLVISREYMG